MTSPVLMGTVDLLPTLLGVLRVDLPPGIDGDDLSEHLLENTGEKADTPGSVFIANYVASDEAARQDMSEWRGVRTHRYTYVETVGCVPWLLFDNQVDPYQQNNLLPIPGDRRPNSVNGFSHPEAPSKTQQEDISPQYQALWESLEKDLDGWLARTRDPFLAGEEMVRYLRLEEYWKQRQTSLG